MGSRLNTINETLTLAITLITIHSASPTIG
jgi:hypothetical protein